MKDCKYEHTIKGDRGGPVKHPPITKLVSSLKRVSTFLEVKSQNTYPGLIQTGPYIENIRAVIGLVTSPRFVEIDESGHNFLNGYRSYNCRWKLNT